MENDRSRILGANDQFVLWISLIVFLVVGSGYFWQQSISTTGLIDFDEIETRHSRFVVNINEAAWQEFANLPGIGEKLAKEIVAHRETHGCFASADQLVDVRGVGKRKLMTIRPYLSLNPSSNSQVPEIH